MGLLLFMAAGDVASPMGLLGGGGVDLGDDSGLLEVVRLLVMTVLEVGVRGADEGATTRLKGPGEGSSRGGRPAEAAAAAAAAPSFKSAAKLFPISEGEACLFR